MQRASSRPASDMFLIWTGRQAEQPTGCWWSHIYVTENTKAEAAEQANANLNKNCMEPWIWAFQYDTNRRHLWPLCWTEPGSESNSAVNRQRCGRSQQTAVPVKWQSARHQKYQSIRSLTLFASFHPVKPQIGGKKIWKATIYGNFPHATFYCFATNKTPPATFSPYMDQGTPPPLPSAPSVSGERTYTVTWLLGVKVHGFVPRWLVQLPPSQCHYFHSATLVRLESRRSAACHVHQPEELVGSVQVRTQNTQWSAVLPTGEGVTAVCDFSSAVILLTA